MHLDPRSWLRVETRGKLTKGDNRSRTEEETYHADRFEEDDRTMVNASTTKTRRHSDSREVRAVIQYNRRRLGHQHRPPVATREGKHVTAAHLRLLRPRHARRHAADRTL